MEPDRSSSVPVTEEYLEEELHARFQVSTILGEFVCAYLKEQAHRLMLGSIGLPGQRNHRVGGLMCNRGMGSPVHCLKTFPETMS